MIYYVAVRDRIEKENINKAIKEFDKSPKIYDAKKVFEEEDKIIKKVNIIISDYDKDRIKEYLKTKKRLIVFTPKSKTPEELLKSKNSYTYKRKNELREILCFANKRRRILKTVATASFLVILSVSLISTLTVYSLSKIEENNKKEEIIEIEQEKEEKKEKRIKAENIVFLGDSITEGYNIQKYFSNIPSINSGTSGYCTDDIIKNLNKMVYEYNPTKVVLLIGTNDIRFRKYGLEGIINNIKTIIDDIKTNRSKAKIYVESIYPINKNSKDSKISLSMIGDRDNSQIIEINESIEDLCKKENVNYIDIYQSLLDEDGNLNLDYTLDGLHISEKGYEVITKKIKEALKIEE